MEAHQCIERMEYKKYYRVLYEKINNQRNLLMDKKIDLISLEREILRTIKKYYGSVEIKYVKIGKNRITIYGKADNHWFKVIVKGNGQTRVYSSSRTIEYSLLKQLRGRHNE